MGEAPESKTRDELSETMQHPTSQEGISTVYDMQMAGIAHT